MLSCPVHRSGDFWLPSGCPESMNMYNILVQTDSICFTVIGEEQACMSSLRTKVTRKAATLNARTDAIPLLGALRSLGGGRAVKDLAPLPEGERHTS